jgi:hypothetical protein
MRRTSSIRRRTRSTLVGAGIVGVVVAGVAVGRAADPTRSLDPVPVPPNDRNYRKPMPDVGTASDVAAVKADVVADLQRDREIMRPARPPADLRAQLSQIYAAAVLDNIAKETEQAMINTSADYRAYDRYKLTVTRWQGVQATSPVAAIATFLGRESWHLVSTATWEQDQTLQWQLVLAKERGKWKLVDEASFDPDERPPTG